MKKLFTKFRKKDALCYDKGGVEMIKNQKTPWFKIHKIVFVDYFEEYSGYFLTDDYKSKVLYNEMNINCSQNTVKVRTGSTSVVKKNMSNSFTMEHGTTCIHEIVFIEYLDKEGRKSLYASHYDKGKLKHDVKELSRLLSYDKVFMFERSDGFNYIASIA